MRSSLAVLTLAFVLALIADARRPAGLLAPALASAEAPAPLVVPLAHQGRAGFWVERAGFVELDLAHRLRPLDLEELSEQRALVAELRGEVAALRETLGAARTEAAVAGRAWGTCEGARKECEADLASAASRASWGPFWALGGAALGGLAAGGGCALAR